MASEPNNLKSGQTCPECGKGRLYVVQTRRVLPGHRTRYLGCDQEDCTFSGKQVVQVNDQGKSLVD